MILDATLLDPMTAQRHSRQKLFRIVISILVMGHLLAIVLPPLSLQTRGPVGQSPAVSTALRPFESYGQMIYIDRGYAFFAPDPGPSHLIQAAVGSDDQDRVELMFPDRNHQWPRLLYHRHFMLSEFMEQIYQPPGPPKELVQLDPEQAEMWFGARKRYEHVRRSVVAHLEHEYPGQSVAIRRIEHRIPELLEYREEPISLTTPSLYRVLLDQPPESGPDPELEMVSPASPGSDTERANTERANTEHTDASSGAASTSGGSGP